MSDRMIKAKFISMQAQPTYRVITIAIFNVATDRMSHIGSVNTDLVLASGLKPKLYKRLTITII